MLEPNKTYLWKDFWKYCQIGKSYKVEIEGATNEIPIVNPNEIYFLVLGGSYFDEARLYKATDFIPIFTRFLGTTAEEFLNLSHNKNNKWYDIAPIFEDVIEEEGDTEQITITPNTLKELMCIYGLDSSEENDINIFITDYLKKLPHITNIDTDYCRGDYLYLEFDFEECKCLCDGQHLLTIKSKKDIWKIDVDSVGTIGGDDQNFWELMDDVKVTVLEII